jgi:hypothetical protein
MRKDSACGDKEWRCSTSYLLPRIPRHALCTSLQRFSILFDEWMNMMSTLQYNAIHTKLCGIIITKNLSIGGFLPKQSKCMWWDVAQNTISIGIRENCAKPWDRLKQPRFPSKFREHSHQHAVKRQQLECGKAARVYNVRILHRRIAVEMHNRATSLWLNVFPLDTVPVLKNY